MLIDVCFLLGFANVRRDRKVPGKPPRVAVFGDQPIPDAMNHIYHQLNLFKNALRRSKAWAHYSIESPKIPLAIYGD